MRQNIILIMSEMVRKFVLLIPGEHDVYVFSKKNMMSIRSDIPSWDICFIWNPTEIIIIRNN
jgi:hypothetical protein